MRKDRLDDVRMHACTAVCLVSQQSHTELILSPAVTLARVHDPAKNTPAETPLRVQHLPSEAIRARSSIGVHRASGFLQVVLSKVPRTGFLPLLNCTRRGTPDRTLTTSRSYQHRVWDPVNFLFADQKDTIANCPLLLGGIKV